jgi:hypothetical protein
MPIGENVPQDLISLREQRHNAEPGNLPDFGQNAALAVFGGMVAE